MGESFSTVATEVWSQISQVVTTITASPILLIPIGLTFAGGAIALAKKLMRRK